MEETIADCVVTVLPCAVEKVRFTADSVETTSVERKVRLFTFNVLPIMVENPINPAEMLDSCTVEAVNVLPCIIENIIPPINNVEPVILETASVLP